MTIMSMPDGIGAVDLMIGFPSPDPASKYENLRALTRDAESATMAFPAEHLFPELRIVMRHGAEPWEDLAVKLMLKWPGLHCMTSGFAPRYYPQAIIDYANTRGADRVMYAGYYPMGLSLRRIFDELPFVPLKDEVWPKFLQENAMRVFKLGEGA